MTNEGEFDLLAAAFRQLTEFRLRYSPDVAGQRESDEMAAELYEAAITRHDLRGLRAGFGDLCGEVESVFWGPEFLREFQKRHSVSLRDVRGKKSPRDRLERILSRGSIETPAELRIAQDRLDSVVDDKERHALEQLIEEYIRDA
jgi:hypothetical protein